MGTIEAQIWKVLWAKMDSETSPVSAEELLSAVIPADHPEYRLLPAYKYAVERLARRGWLNGHQDTDGTIRYSPARPRNAGSA